MQMKKFWGILMFVAVSCHLSAQTGQGPNILYIGDSITDGNWGHQCNTKERNTSDLNHIYGHGYMFLCAAKYMNQYPERDYHFYNRGISGNALSDMAARWDKDCLALQPDVLSVLIGINDVDRFQSRHSGEFDLQKFESTYCDLLRKALSQNPKLQIVICEPFVFKVGARARNWEQWDQTTRQCAAVAKKLAKKFNAVFLPFQSMFDQLAEIYPDVPASYWIWDGIHPTAAGHQRMAELWIKSVKMPK